MNGMSWLACEVSLGLFSEEYAIRGKLFNSTDFSLFTSRETVHVDKVPDVGEFVAGKISVEVLDEDDKLALVSLPQPAFENGQTITVTKDLIQPA